MTFNRPNREKLQKRIPMPSGTIFPVVGTDILIARDGQDKEYSSGSTCLVYRGHIAAGTGIVTGTHVIIKEFYPSENERSGGAVRLSDGSLRFPDSPSQKEFLIKGRKQFLQGLEYQKELAGSNAMEISVRPLFISEWGDSTYIISDAHRGSDLGAQAPATLRECVSAAISIAETMGILHDNGYLMTDIKADNFLWIRRPNSVRIIDTDSVVPFRNTERLLQKPLFANHSHCSPELEFLNIKMREGTPQRELAMLKRAMLTPNADLYSEGVFFFELFFRRLPEFSDYAAYLKDCARRGFDGEKKLIDELTDLYGAEIRAAGKNSSMLLSSLLGILQKLLIRSPAERRSRGYNAETAIISDFEEILAQLSSEKIVLRREAARANARFAAYNLLQKHPLFNYPAGGGTELRAAIIGSHAMRTDMLSALISIGQMPDLPLTIELIAEDAEDFWEEYLSEKHNPGLAGAVTWEYTRVRDIDSLRLFGNSSSLSGSKRTKGDRSFGSIQAGTIGHGPGSAPDSFDPALVSRPLAHLILCSQAAPSTYLAAENRTDTVFTPSANYYIILEEDPEKRNAWISYAACRASNSKIKGNDIKTLIGCLHFETDDSLSLGTDSSSTFSRQTVSPEAALSRVKGVAEKGSSFDGISKQRTSGQQESYTLCPISAEAFTEEYSEKMFSEKIFHMGLMAHAYYCNVMDSEEDVDMAALEKDFRRDLYNITSSERCALHGVYKMAGIGIDSKKPGHFRKFNRMISNPVTLERLAWLEHLSWTAFMLTSGALPVSMDEFDSYAYQGPNDWKDKSSGAHLRHPLLVASGYSVNDTLSDIETPEEITPDLYARLDPLDRVSVQITKWYADHRETARSEYLEAVDSLLTLCKENSIQTNDSDKSINTASVKNNSPVQDEILLAPEDTESPDPAVLLSSFRRTGLDCIEKMGTSVISQDPPSAKEWKNLLSRIYETYSCEEIRGILSDIEHRIMKPVFHSFEDRDFKQNDRELTCAVIDMIT